MRIRGIAALAIAFVVAALAAAAVQRGWLRPAVESDQSGPPPAATAAPPSEASASVVRPSGPERTVRLPYYVIKDTSTDPVLVEQTTPLRVRGSAGVWRQAHTALDALAAFPQANGALRNPLPRGARILGVHVDNNGIATVDLSPQFLDNFNGGAREEQVTIYSLVNTVGTVKGVTGVRFSVSGKPIDEFAGHLDLTDPLTPDRSLVEPSS